MSENVFEIMEQSCSTLNLDFSSKELSVLAQEEEFTAEQLHAIGVVFEHLRQKKNASIIEMLLRTSRLPKKSPKTFDNYDFTLIKGRDVKRLVNLRSLSPLYSHQNIAFIGPAGTGKTHLAQAFGYECCLRGFKTYFIKMSELRDRFTKARKNGTTEKVLVGLVRPSCLIIDEVGHCEFDKENTRLFFDLIDRRYNKEGSFNIIFTSNKSPSQWKGNFNEDDALLCALDRIFDDAIVFNIRGDSYRGRRLEKVALRTSRARDEDGQTERKNP